MHAGLVGGPTNDVRPAPPSPLVNTLRGRPDLLTRTGHTGTVSKVERERATEPEQVKRWELRPSPAPALPERMVSRRACAQRPQRPEQQEWLPPGASAWRRPFPRSWPGVGAAGEPPRTTKNRGFNTLRRLRDRWCRKALGSLRMGRMATTRRGNDDTEAMSATLETHALHTRRHAVLTLAVGTNAYARMHGRTRRYTLLLDRGLFPAVGVDAASPTAPTVAAEGQALQPRGAKSRSDRGETATAKVVARKVHT